MELGVVPLAVLPEVLLCDNNEVLIYTVQRIKEPSEV